MKILIRTAILVIVVLCIGYFYYPGFPKLYYIEEVGIYIKTFPLSDGIIIAFSDKKIARFSDSLDYVKVNRGNNYSTNFLFDPNNKHIIYNSGTNSLKDDSNLIRYDMVRISHRDTTYFEYKKEAGFLLKYPYVNVSFSFWGNSEKVLLKNREDIYYTEIKSIK